MMRLAMLPAMLAAALAATAAGAAAPRFDPGQIPTRRSCCPTARPGA